MTDDHTGPSRDRAKGEGERSPFLAPLFVQRCGRARDLALHLLDRPRRPRPERLCGIHNPWGTGTAFADAWAFLDLCEDATVVDAVAAVLGPDIVLWDSTLVLDPADYRAFVAAGQEGRLWPVDPLAGAVVTISLADRPACRCTSVEALTAESLAGLDETAPLYVIRYMPATSRFVRDPQFPANRTATEENPLVNVALRPLWLVRGDDRAGNDFVTGFVAPVPQWAGSVTMEI